VIGVPVYLFALVKLNVFGLPWLIGGYAMSCGLVGVLALLGVIDGASGLASGLASLIVVLLLASCFYAMFVAGLFALALVNSPSRAFVQRKYGSGGPGIVGSLVTRFDTCTSCKLHFRGTCDGCGRTAEQIRAAQR
jgi:hypothetical protein